MTQALYLTPWVTVSVDGSQYTTWLLDAAHPLPLWCKLEDATGTPGVPPEPNLCAVLFTAPEQANPSEVAAWLASVAADGDILEVWRE